MRRALVTAAAGVTLLAGAAPASAVPVSTTLDYTCNFPLLKPQPLTLEISSDIPDQIAPGTATPPFDIDAVAEVSSGAAYGLSAVETATLEGTATANSTVTLPGGLALPVAMPTTIPKVTIPSSGGFQTSASGKNSLPPGGVNFARFPFPFVMFPFVMVKSPRIPSTLAARPGDGIRKELTPGRAAENASFRVPEIGALVKCIFS